MTTTESAAVRQRLQEILEETDAALLAGDREEYHHIASRYFPALLDLITALLAEREAREVADECFGAEPAPISYTAACASVTAAEVAANAALARFGEGK